MPGIKDWMSGVLGGMGVRELVEILLGVWFQRAQVALSSAVSGLGKLYRESDTIRSMFYKLVLANQENQI